MDNLLHILLLHASFLLIQLAAAQSQSLDGGSSSSSNFQPSLAVVIGMLAVMFSLTFVLLLYAKFCHRPSNSSTDRTQPDPTRAISDENGVDKTVIESLPFFPFSTLGGLKQGLDCSICLSRFTEPDILRLLPGCRHAFHMDCIDRWLHSHSTCPLCRRHVSADDLALCGADTLELYVEREADQNRSRRLSSRFSSIGRSFRKLFDRQEEVEEEDEEKQIGINHHKFNHRISFNLMMRSRWSNVSSSDLVFLNDVEKKIEFENDCCCDKAGLVTTSSSSSIFNNGEKRSISEIVIHPRRLMNEIISSSSSSGGNGNNDNNSSSSVNEEKMRKLWMPIATKTARWFVNRDKRSTENVDLPAG
ncbi:Putative RING-H2 finger protein ATL12 [Striga hermonthica]|uniref:RING-type E3 ubiquitin transferase n=1 Tax=Striga hermonthica TaxID=68872 RepID=A0A9N7RH15_STRHE|nr:Putative RING-H2 finger protein ATL12 [Striga hermonthica]